MKKKRLYIHEVGTGNKGGVVGNRVACTLEVHAASELFKSLNVSDSVLFRTA